MAETDEPSPSGWAPAQQGASPPPPTSYGPPPQGYGAMATPYGGPPPAMPVGKVRSTGGCVLLTIVTIGFYTLYWYFKTHQEMKRHSGQGIGGLVALVIAFFLGFVSPFLSSHEVGDLYERRGQQPPVTALTGLWALLLGWFFFVGLIVWFVKTNGALNAYWRTQGAR